MYVVMLGFQATPGLPTVEKYRFQTNWTDNTQNVTVFFFARRETGTEK